MRSVARPRRYVARHWLRILRPVLRYSATRGAFVLRGIGVAIAGALLAVPVDLTDERVDVDHQALPAGAGTR